VPAPSYTVVTCHFGDTFWIEHTLGRVDQLSDGRIEGVLIVDQDRQSGLNRDLLAGLPRVQEVLDFPADQEQVAILGHDHPAALNQALRQVDFCTSHVMVLDSDCFPIDTSWLDRLQDTTMAADPAKWGLTHPCLMVFPSALAPQLDFSEGLLEVGMDTGRLVGLQATRLGQQVEFSRPEGAFMGRKGTFYLGRSVYHHGSSSFASSADARLLGAVDVRTEAVYRQAVQEGRFSLTRMERALLAREQARVHVRSVVKRRTS